jgi:tetratricopeptide (TPR) repeat protein
MFRIFSNSILLTAFFWLITLKVYAEKFEAIDYEGLRLFHLDGTPEKIAYNAGKLSTPESTDDGIVNFMSQFVQKTVANTSFFRENPYLKFIVPTYLGLKYHNRFINQIDSSYLSQFDSMTRAMGLNKTRARRSLVSPDIIHLLISDVVAGRTGLMPSTENAHELAGALLKGRPGCTSFVALPQITQDGRTYFGRVQDYPGVGTWDKYPAVYFMKPKNKYKYVSVGSEGLAFGGVTVMNEHGLAMAVHSILAKNPNRKGNTLLYVTQKMIEESKTIEEAASICNANPFATGWMILISDLKEGISRAARLEVDSKNKKCHLIWSQPKDQFISQTNFYSNPEAAEDELKIGPFVDDYNVERKIRLDELLNSFKGQMNLENSIRILSDRYDQRMKRHMSYAPSGITAADQLLTVVMVPESREIWVSNGLAPTATQGKMIYLSFDDLENLQNLSSTSSNKSIDLGLLLAGTPNDYKFWPAYPHYKEAYMQAANNYDTRAASRAILKAIQTEPDEPIYHFLQGLLLMRNESPAEAIPYFEKLIEPSPIFKDKPLDGHRILVARLFLGKAYDTLNRRSEAIEQYLKIVQSPGVYAGLAEAASRHLDEPFLEKNLSKIEPDLKGVDTLSYY